VADICCLSACGEAIALKVRPGRKSEVLRSLIKVFNIGGVVDPARQCRRDCDVESFTIRELVGEDHGIPLPDIDLVIRIPIHTHLRSRGYTPVRPEVPKDRTGQF